MQEKVRLPRRNRSLFIRNRLRPLNPIGRPRNNNNFNRNLFTRNRLRHSSLMGRSRSFSNNNNFNRSRSSFNRFINSNTHHRRAHPP